MAQARRFELIAQTGDEVFVEGMQGAVDFRRRKADEILPQAKERRPVIDALAGMGGDAADDFAQLPQGSALFGRQGGQVSVDLLRRVAGWLALTQRGRPLPGRR